MYGLNAIMTMNARRAAAEIRDTPPPVPREKRRMGWFTDRALVKLKDELLATPGGPGKEAQKMLGGIEAELDYRRREARIILAAREKKETA